MAEDPLSRLRGQDAAVRSRNRIGDRADAFAPGAVLPDHEHVNIEQTYVLEGSLVDKEGPAKGIVCKAGEFIWREANSRHVAWCREGGLMLAIFQVPNKFFEADGRVIDSNGQDWDEAWGYTGKA